MADTARDIRFNKNFSGALRYLLGWVTGLIFLFSGSKEKFIRFHAIQSIIFSVALMVIFFLLSSVWVIGWIVSGLVGILAFVLWIILVVTAYQGKMFKLPLIGQIADKLSK